VSIPPATVEVLGALSRVMTRWGRWYLFGAQAVAAYGLPRLSADVDVTVALAPDRTEEFVQDMDANGFALRASDPGFVRRTGVLPFVHRATAMPLDVVLAGSGLEEAFLERARGVDVGGLTVPLIGLEDLMVAKILAGRPKDIEDAAGLWRLHGDELDQARIREVLELLEEALGQSDLVPTFEAIVRRAVRE
jgi:hypothetical protein